MNARNFLAAEWRYLAMINYEIEPAILKPFVPRGTELDSWNGKTFVSMVGFPIPFHRNFEEVNLRFYVRRKADDGWRRGVVFIKEIVPRTAIAMAARIMYNEKYVAMPMRHIIDGENGSLKPDGSVEYGWRFRARWNYLRIKTAGEPQPIADGSEEEFITEHYWGYAIQRNGGTVEYQVEHPRWLVWQAAESSFDCNVAEIYGERFVESLSGTASSAFVAQGSPISVGKGMRI